WPTGSTRRRPGRWRRRPARAGSGTERYSSCPTRGWVPSSSDYTVPMLDFATTAFVSILFLVDPPGTVPAFIALTARHPPERQRKTALVASLTATLTLMGFAAVGSLLFKALGLTLPAFQIAGGFIL